mmetsp:Transcript_6862/g.10764  ORF Transcript_6862/g.10764 Transcript_6862/m.10764 type:complete len:113 (-) Transcript_6862:553-891(-)|eukprot:CAMPEP_0184657160 /NCGR_PEP_ID=MMETSP0308-20130426/17020_1 /TAXON_ID=38269 /ORGANISM="Gloeochaete witrockiana, Strain SAG 46.84" /LENGTH=112 /DNA_ID=CAMNT_0027094595 /DNA_START=189 /DNA_END=527 /DNA_ORIENTATION=+
MADAEVEESNVVDQRSKHEGATTQDLERLTDFQEEKELDQVKVREAMSALAKAERAEAEAQAARERELAAVAIKKEDVDLMEKELEITKQVAERTLREHRGDVVAAIRTLIK